MYDHFNHIKYHLWLSSIEEIFTIWGEILSTVTQKSILGTVGKPGCLTHQKRSVTCYPVMRVGGLIGSGVGVPTHPLLIQ